MASLRTFSMMAVLVAAPVMVAGSGCTIEEADGGTTGPVGPNYKYPRQQDFCNAIAEAECSAAVVNECYQSSSDSLAADTDKCVTMRSFPSSCNPTGFTYDPAHAEPCVASRVAIYGDAILTQEEIKADYEACLSVFSNSMAAGSACTFDVECDTSTGLRCIVHLGEAQGTCAVPEIVQPGDPCGGSSQVCTEGRYCNGDCVSKEGLNQACSATEPCADEFLCSVDTNTCISKLANTDPCTANDECAEGFCIMDGTAGTCAGQYKLNFSNNTCEDFK